MDEVEGARAGRVLPALLAVLAVLAVTTTVVLWLDRRDAAEAVAARPADVGVRGWAQAPAGRPVAVAQRVARAYFGIDHRTVSRDVAAVAALGTDGFARAYRRDADAMLDRVRRERITLTGRLVPGGTATEALSGTRAQVLVALDVVTSRAGHPGPPQPYRLRVLLERSGERWRVAQLEEVT